MDMIFLAEKDLIEAGVSFVGRAQYSADVGYSDV